MSDTPDLTVQLEQSDSTDMMVLLKAKEDAKRLVMNDPSPANLSSFEKAGRMLENAKTQRSNLKDVNAVLAYVEEAGRRLKKTKLYEDISAGKIKRQTDGTFRQRDVDRYAASLPTMGASDATVRDAAARARRKEEEEIRRIKAAADKDEFRLAVEQGKYIARDQIYQELAGRAITLFSGLRTRMESKAADLIHTVGGNPKKSHNLVHALNDMLDEAMNEYAQAEDFELEITPPPADADDQQSEDAS